MIIFPLVAAGVSALFSILLFRRYASRKRLAELAWSIALAQFAIASLIVAAGMSGGWDPTLYRGYWLFGALLNVPWLALGSIALVSRPVVARIALLIAIALSLYGVVAVLQAAPDDALLRGEPGIPRGREVWGESASVVLLARLYSIVAWLVVVAIAAWSSRARRGVRPPAERVRGNALIAVGVTIVAAGGFLQGRVGGEVGSSAFSVTLAAGVTTMFLGFLFATRAGRHRVEDPGESPT